MHVHEIQSPIHWSSLARQVRVALLRQSEEELKEARQEAARQSREVDVQRGEVQRLQEELQREEEKMRGAIREKQSLSTYIKQLSRELEELRSKHQVAGSNQSINLSATHFIHPPVHLSINT